jgi:hypothetical protein
MSRPANAATWTASSVSAILANPKNTGHMVFGRQRKINGKMTTVPAAEWLWLPGPTHPAIISRAQWQAAQEIGAEHGTSRDGTGPAATPRRGAPTRCAAGSATRRACGVCTA